MDEFIWWKHGVIYQIYPRSYKDSNHDGIGDIRGIIEKIDYLQDLGIDAVWLSPINRSPMLDFGYDIQDYHDIDPLFGNLDDFKELLKLLHERNIRLIMDLVVNHSSDQHDWFLESSSSIDNPKRDWYIWRRGEGNKPPNNWKSAFGGSAWEYDSKTDEYYLHSFLKEQPDLNWRNRDLRNAVFDMMAYWLGMGVDGFRLDVVNWFIKDRKFRDNPFQWLFFHPERHKYDRNRPAVHKLLKKMRKFIDRYDDRMLVGEVFTMPPGDPGLSARFLGKKNNELHLTFDFSLMYRLWSGKQFYNALKKWYSRLPEKGWPAIVLSNHDQPRGRSRYMGPGDSDCRARVAAVFLLTVKGTPFLYYGEELGLKNSIISRDDIVDPLGKKFWPLYKGRDLSRGPMPWDDSHNGGFSTMRPWLPLCPDCRKVSVKSQNADRYSMLNFHRKLIFLRKKYSELSMGEFIPVIKGRGNIIAYYRKTGENICFIILNFSSLEKEIRLKNRAQWKVLLSTHRSGNVFFTGLEFDLNSNEALILKRVGKL